MPRATRRKNKTSDSCQDCFVLEANLPKSARKKKKVSDAEEVDKPETVSKTFEDLSIVEEDENAKSNNLNMATSGSTPEVASPVTNEQLMRKLVSNSQEMARLLIVVEELRGTILALQNSNDTLQKELQEARVRKERLREQVAEAKGEVAVARRRVDELDQYTRRNNLRIYGIPETGEEERDLEDEGGNAGPCERTVLHLIRNKLRLSDVDSEDIEVAHRLGKKQSGPITSPRSVIVRFVSRKIRDLVLHKRRSHKGTGLVVVEDLTHSNYQLLSRVKEDTLCKIAWTKNGKVFMETVTGRITRVKSLLDLNDVGRRQILSSTPRHTDTTRRRGGASAANNATPQHSPIGQS